LPIDEIKHVHAPIEASFDVQVKQVSCGEEHTALLNEKGEVWMIGNNSLG
jgi:alpha-tubulin suppressor-like RCC1 family protein